MKPEELIASGLLETYVLGHTSPEESAEVQRMALLFPEVATEIEKIEEALIGFAELHTEAPSSKTKERILTNLNLLAQPGPKSETPVDPPASPKPVKVIPLYEKTVSRRLVTMRWVAAASLTLLVGSAVLNLFLYNRLSTTQAQLRTTNDEKTFFAQQQKELSGKYASATQEVNDLRRYITVPRNSENHMIMLSGTENKTVMAMVYMNVKNNQVCVDPMNLPATPDGMQYQLWALMPDGSTMDNGVFDVSDSTKMMVVKEAPGDAVGFAITLEKNGGVSKSDGPVLLLGKIAP